MDSPYPILVPQDILLREVERLVGGAMRDLADKDERARVWR